MLQTGWARGLVFSVIAVGWGWVPGGAEAQAPVSSAPAAAGVAGIASTLTGFMPATEPPERRSEGPAGAGSGTLPDRRSGRPVALGPLYASFVALQVLDTRSTLEGLSRGGRECNPILSGPSRNPVAFVAVKGGLTAWTIYMHERLWKKNRAVAVLLMGGLNVSYALVVRHNLRELDR